MLIKLHKDKAKCFSKDLKLFVLFVCLFVFQDPSAPPSIITFNVLQLCGAHLLFGSDAMRHDDANKKNKCVDSVHCKRGYNIYCNSALNLDFFGGPSAVYLVVSLNCDLSVHIMNS